MSKFIGRLFIEAPGARYFSFQQQHDESFNQVHTAQVDVAGQGLIDLGRVKQLQRIGSLHLLFRLFTVQATTNKKAQILPLELLDVGQAELL